MSNSRNKLLREPIMALTVLIMLALHSSRAWAQSDVPTSERAFYRAPETILPAVPVSSRVLPWFEGVPIEQQRKAADLHTKGNTYIRDAEEFASAIPYYENALQYWDHPLFHYHLALALNETDGDPEEIYEHAQASLRYGGAALNADERSRVLSFSKSARAKLVEIEIACEQAGVRVEIEKKLLVIGPGVRRKLFNPGKYEVRASKEGYIPVQQTVILLPHEPKRVEIKLFTLEDVARLKRYWEPWKPWTVFGTGVAIATIGGGLYWRAKHNIETHDEDLLRDCPVGCMVHDANSPESILKRGVVQKKIGDVAIVAGGASMITGIALALINRPRTSQIDRTKESFNISILTKITDNQANISALVSF